MPKRILVIDDESSIRKSFQLALEDSGYAVQTVESGEKGIKAVQKDKYDLIYLDLKMPGMNGAETLRHLREILPQTPVYIITAFYEEFFDDLKIAVKEGIEFEVLRKPVSMDQISTVTKSILEGPAAI